MDEHSSKRNQRKRESKPRDLFNIIFWALVAAAIILVIVLIATAAKLGKANKALASAEGGASNTQITEYETKISDLSAQLEAVKTENDQLKAELQTLGGGTQQPAQGTGSGTASGTTSGAGTSAGAASGTSGTAPSTSGSSSWLNLAPFTKLKVKPKDSEFYSGFETRYVKATELNVRAGPAATYDKLSVVKQGDQISAAAESGEWTLISYGSGYGWVKTEFLSLTPVSVSSSGTSSSSSSSSSGGGQSSSSQTGTSGNIQ